MLDASGQIVAWAAGFKDRGTLRTGMAADIVVYDLIG